MSCSAEESEAKTGLLLARRRPHEAEGRQGREESAIKIERHDVLAFWIFDEEDAIWLHDIGELRIYGISSDICARFRRV